MDMNERQQVELACARLVNQFSLYNDARDFKALSELFTLDGEFARPTDPENFTTGRENILAAFQARPHDRVTRHIISNIVIDVLDNKRAKGSCYATLFMAPVDAEPATFGLKASPSQLIGEFYMDFALTDAGWKIARQSGKIIFTT